jgi:hypothetical protein
LLFLKVWCEEQNLNPDEIYSIFESLKDRGFCNWETIGPTGSITTFGILEVEDMNLINKDLLEKNFSIRTQILEEMFNEERKLNTQLIMGPDIRSKIGLSRKEFDIHFKLLEETYNVKSVSANKIKLTEKGRLAIKDLEYRRSFQKEFIELNEEEAHNRGRKFDVFISKLLERYGWTTEPKIKGESEEIDVSIIKNSDIYLIECKWESKAIEAKKIRDFIVKIDKRPTINGIFISMSGFTNGAIKEIKDHLTKRLIIPFGKKDMEEILSEYSSFDEKLKIKRESMLIRREIIIDNKICKA